MWIFHLLASFELVYFFCGHTLLSDVIYGWPLTLFCIFRKEAKVRFHPSCDILSNNNRGGKVSASANVKAVTRNSNTDWFIFDEMTKSGRVAMIKGVTPVPSICVAMFSGKFYSDLEYLLDC